MFGMFKMTREKVAKKTVGGSLFEKKLAGLDLSGLGFHKTSFLRADLTGANLSGSQFFGCDFEHAVLDGIQVAGARFTGCRLPLRHRDDLAGAQIEGGTWTHADRLLDEDKRKSRAGQDLRGYSFRTLEELGLDFARANLRHADFMLAKLYECDFRGADLTGANLHGASFQSCKFQGAILDGVTLTGTTFTMCHLSGPAKPLLTEAGLTLCEWEGDVPPDPEPEISEADSGFAEANCILDSALSGRGPAPDALELDPAPPTSASPDERFVYAIRAAGDDVNEVAQALLTAVGKELGDFKLRVDPRDEDIIEIRGRAGDLPLRLKKDGAGLGIELEAKMKEGPASGELLLELRYDESAIPTERQPDDPFSDEDLVQVFVARGLFHRCEGSEISMLEAAGMVPAPDRTVAFYNKVTPALREQLTRVLTAHTLHRYLVYENSILVTIWSTEELLANGRPFSMLVDLARLVAATAIEVKPLDHWVEVGPAHAGAFTLVDCTFCGSRFGLDVRAKCPNCGGGYAGDIQ